MFRIIERCLCHPGADPMPDGLDGDLNFDVRSRFGKVPLCCQRDHLLQKR